MARIDYYRDPAAPEPNSLVPAASAIVTYSDGRLVLHRRRDNDLWALPGGGMELGESVAGTVVREVKEETGLTVEPLYIVGVYSDPDHVFAYDNGEVRQEFSICVACRVIDGTVTVSDESTEVITCSPQEAITLPMHPRIRVRIVDYLNGERAALH
jgi:8-oxo-dGTP pyrophosphatase MutT (NUDIX family)